MAALVHAPRRAIATISLAAIALHNLFDGVPPQALGGFAPLWQFLHVPGFAIPGTLFIGYPLVPWFAVMALGYVLAPIYQWTPAPPPPRADLERQPRQRRRSSRFAW